MQLNEASELSDEQREAGYMAAGIPYVATPPLRTLSVLIVTITLIALLTLIFYFFYVALR